MDYRKEKGHYFRLLVLSEKGEPVPEHLQFTTDKKQAALDAVTLGLFGIQAEFYCTTTDGLPQTLYGIEFKDPAFHHFLFRIVDPEKFETFSSVTICNITNDIAKRFAAATWYQLYTVFCPFSTFTEMRSLAKSTLIVEDTFNQMGKKYARVLVQTTPSLQPYVGSD